MAARSWEQFDADLASGKSPRDHVYTIIKSHGVDGSKSLEEIKAANPHINVVRCPPAIAKGAVFMGGKPTLPRAANDNRRSKRKAA